MPRVNTLSVQRMKEYCRENIGQIKEIYHDKEGKAIINEINATLESMSDNHTNCGECCYKKKGNERRENIHSTTQYAILL